MGPCGDTKSFWLNVGDNKIQIDSFYMTGSGSSMTCGSMAISLASSKRSEEAAAISQQDILTALGGLPAEV
jgi:NifU-like protein involved in Fe-S cluster formation